MTETISLPRTAKGKRPQVFDDPAVDHVVTMCLELATELYSVYARLNAVERLLDKNGALDRAALDAYAPDETAQAELAEWRELFLERMFRTIRADQG